MHTRTSRALAAAAALALFASACTDTPTAAPAGRAPDGRTSLTSASAATLVSNGVKYRDHGGKPATGRSGNAVMNALAMLDKEGMTTLSVTTRHATDWWRQGHISRVQIKASTPAGKHVFTRNLNGFDDTDPGGPLPIPLSSFNGVLQFQGLGRGDQLRVQANVRGLDENRTDVVTVTETVKRLPDLRVEMAAPAEVETGTSVNILAVVSEANGDMGVYGVCELYVAGQRVDEAQGVWVDAGDAVTCAMTWTFAAPGSYPVEVRVSTGHPEWDSGNNTDSAVIQVNGDSPGFYTSASFNQTAQVDSTLLEQSWRSGPSGQAGESVSEQVNASTHQYAYMYAYMPAQIPGTLDVRASMTTGAHAVTSAAFTMTGYGTAPNCVSEYDGRAMLDICTYTYEGGHTYVNYSWAAGTVTYHSREYSRMWDQLTGAELGVYHWNNDYGWDDGPAPLGDDWRFEVRLGSTGGEHVAAHTLRLEAQAPWELVEPYACNTFDEPWWDYSSTVCRSSSSRSWSILGF